MDCDRMARLLPDYWQGALQASDADFVASHLKVCTACRELVALGEGLAELPSEQPSPALRERFHAMLDAYEEGRGEAEGASPLPGAGFCSEPFDALRLVVEGLGYGRVGLMRTSRGH